MFPSQNLFKPGTGELMIMPSPGERHRGLYFLSQTEAGRKKINALLPKAFHITGTLQAKDATKLYNKIASEDPKAFSRLVLAMKDLGDKTAYESGFSVGLKDVVVDYKHRDAEFAKADTHVAALRRNHKPGQALDKLITDTYTEAAAAGYKHIKNAISTKDNGFYHMVTSGALAGKDSQLMPQLISAPGVVKGARDRPITTADQTAATPKVCGPATYFIAAYGVRKGMMDRALQTSQPGALNKDIMVSAIDHIVTENDCGVKKGLQLPITSRDAQERYLAQDQHGFARNTLVTPQLVSQLQEEKTSTISSCAPDWSAWPQTGRVLRTASASTSTACSPTSVTTSAPPVARP